MAQIHSITDDQAEETLNISVNDPTFDFLSAKQMAKEKALEICDNPMILSWKNSKTSQVYPDYECGVETTPFWIRYAQGRGANLTINFNDGEYVFMLLKM